ncbi:unnamed protein product [Sphagnum compactum]
MKQKQVEEEEEAGAVSEAHGSPPPPHSAARESAAAAGGGSSSTEQEGSFDCNICLELAQDPVVTLCGHLFCWPCLYRWLQMHSVCQECPVCKASVEEEMVIPLYGRGKIGSVDPRTKTVPGVNNIPHRPAGQRPDTARHHTHEHQHQHHAFNFTAGMPPVAGPATTARFGNITLSASFGLFPSLFGFQLQGFPDATSMDQQQEALLSRLLLLLGCFVLVCLLLF